MNQENRVLSRKGARELTPQETGYVFGAIRTQTMCTADGPTGMDGDASIGEC
jgi:hypothetical protein